MGAKSWVGLVSLAGLVSGIFCQQYFYSTGFGGVPRQFGPQEPVGQQFGPLQPIGRQFGPQQPQAPPQGRFFQDGGRGTFGGRQFPSSSSSSSSASASAGGGAVNFPNNGGGGGAINASLQAQFREIFDWNKDLNTDPRFSGCTVPDIGDVERACPKRALYYGLNPEHRMAVGMVKTILTGPNNPEQTVCLAGRMRDLPGMNPNVWIRGMLGAHLSDVGLFDLQVPPMVEVMPHIFISRESLQAARRQGSQAASGRRCTVVDGSVGRDNGVENRLWYFREDVQVNSFHLNWHLIYPFTGVTRKADRQGELFYFSHHNHIARYHAERLSNGLGRVVPLNMDINAPVPDAYHPHLDDTNSGSSWTPRRANRPIRDTVFINITGVPPNISVADRVLHVRRVEDSIRNRGLVLRNGGSMPLDSRTGIDILGDIVEATVFTPNGEYYGNFGFHNEGHVLLGLVEDPQNRTGLPPGVMIEVATSMRDPVFYTYHTSMDETFDLHKQLLPPYQLENGELPLKWDGIEISSLEVVPDVGISNQLTTFFNQRTFELSRGLDFNRSGVQGAVSACITHLDHNPFTYRIYANRNPQSSSGRATVRIFMAPRFDENGRRYNMIQQRKIFFMLDLFTVQLQPGPNRITRRSTDSALTIEIPQSYSQLNQTKQDRIKERPRTYCGCGWPHHLLLPKGTERGLPFDLFVMLTNGDEDYVAPRNNPRRASGECKPAPIYCGRLNDTYPDARPMGYPFDRLPYNAPRSWWDRPRVVETLEEYTSGIPNAAMAQVTITHTGPGQAVLQQPQNSIRFEEDESQRPRPRPQQFPSGAQSFPSSPAPGVSFEQSSVRNPPLTSNSFQKGGNGGAFSTSPARNPPSTSSGFQQGGNGGYVTPISHPGSVAGYDGTLETVPLIHQEHQLFDKSREDDSSDDHDHSHDHHHGSSEYYNYNNNLRGFPNFQKPYQPLQQQNYHQTTFQHYLTSPFFNGVNSNYGK